MFRTVKDIIIPKGTIVHMGPKSSKYFTPHGEIILSFDRDTTGNLRFDIEDSLTAGVIERVENG